MLSNDDINVLMEQAQSELHADGDISSRVVEVFEIQNMALSATKDCPLVFRTPDDCACCGNSECIVAFQEQTKLWPELKERNTQRPDVPSRFSNTPGLALRLATKSTDSGPNAKSSGLYSYEKNNDESS